MSDWQNLYPNLKGPFKKIKLAESLFKFKGTVQQNLKCRISIQIYRDRSTKSKLQNLYPNLKGPFNKIRLAESLFKFKGAVQQYKIGRISIQI